MYPWISYNPSRRDVLKGHRTAKGVRAAIKWARSYNERLRIFAQDEGAPGQVLYVELSPASWDSTFAEES